MNKQNLVNELYKVIRDKNVIINSLVENSESQSITNKVLIDRLKKQETELNEIKSLNLN
jgi:hypothetical protein